MRVRWRYFLHLLAGAGFFLANLAAVALYRSGPVLVEALTGKRAGRLHQSGIIGMYLMVYVTISQFAQSLIPGLRTLWSSRAHRDEYSGGWAVFMRIGCWSRSRVRRRSGCWPAGRRWYLLDFAGAAPALRWISLAMPPAVIVWAANVTATVSGRSGQFSGFLTALLVFLAGTLALTPVYGAAGFSRRVEPGRAGAGAGAGRAAAA